MPNDYPHIDEPDLGSLASAISSEYPEYLHRLSLTRDQKPPKTGANHTFTRKKV